MAEIPVGEIRRVMEYLRRRNRVSSGQVDARNTLEHILQFDLSHAREPFDAVMAAGLVKVGDYIYRGDELVVVTAIRTYNPGRTSVEFTVKKPGDKKHRLDKLHYWMDNTILVHFKTP